MRLDHGRSPPPAIAAATPSSAIPAAISAAAGRPVLWLPTFDAAEPVLRALLRDGDLCLVLGAGDVDELGRRLVAPG